MHPKAGGPLVALTGAGSLAVGRRPGTGEEGRGGLGPGVAGGGWVVQAEPRAGASVRWGAVLGWGQAAECVQRLGSAQDSAALGAPRGPRPLLALKKAWGHGVGASGARQLSYRSLSTPARPPRPPHLPDCPLHGRTSRRQVSGPRLAPCTPRAGPFGAACLWP